MPSSGFSARSGFPMRCWRVCPESSIFATSRESSSVGTAISSSFRATTARKSLACIRSISFPRRTGPRWKPEFPMYSAMASPTSKLRSAPRMARRPLYYFTGKRLEFEGRPCLVGIGIDISGQKQAEQEREKRFQAEAADRIKSSFLATISHELRTPLNSIIGFTGILLQGLAGPLNAEQDKQLDMVRKSARHLLALVNDVLDISKIEAGQFEVAREPFDPRQSILKVVSIMTPSAEAKGLVLRADVAEDLGEAIGDQRRFEQILLNLLSNALKFTERGEVRLVANLRDDYTVPGISSTQPAICLEVHDTGIGRAVAARPDSAGHPIARHGWSRSGSSPKKQSALPDNSDCRRDLLCDDGRSGEESRGRSGGIY